MPHSKVFFRGGKGERKGERYAGNSKCVHLRHFRRRRWIGLFSFFVSRSWEGKLSEGDCEEIPFGRQDRKNQVGNAHFYVLFLSTPPPPPSRLVKRGFSKSCVLSNRKINLIVTAGRNPYHGPYRGHPGTLLRFPLALDFSSCFYPLCSKKKP